MELFGNILLVTVPQTCYVGKIAYKASQNTYLLVELHYETIHGKDINAALW